MIGCNSPVNISVYTIVVFANPLILRVLHADALDRFRLGPRVLNERSLRTENSREPVDFGPESVDETIGADVMKKTMDATRPFADKLLGKKK